MSETRWQPGDVILIEEFLTRSPIRQLINVRPQVVVRDDAQCLVLLSLPGSTWMTRDVPGRNSLTVNQRIALYMKEELDHEWYERTVSGGVLSLYPPDVAHSIRLFGDPEWQLRSWYVNLEDPYTRAEQRIQVNDHTLDLLVTPELTWTWKDEPEFEALVAAGKIPPEQARAIRAEGNQAIERTEARQWPFNERPEWRPDPSWPAPQVKDYWSPQA